MIAKLMTNDDDSDVADNVSNGDIVLTGYFVTSKSGLIIRPTPVPPLYSTPAGLDAASWGGGLGRGEGAALGGPGG